MENQIQYSIRGGGTTIETISTFERVSPWKTAEISFNWVNFDYPFFHLHDYYELTIIISGSIKNCIGGKEILMRVGDAFIIRPSDRHMLKGSGNAPLQLINFIVRRKYMESLCALYAVNLGAESTGESGADGDYDGGDLSFTIDNALREKLLRETVRMQSQKDGETAQNILHTKLLFNEVFSVFLTQKTQPHEKMPDWMQNLLILLSDPSTTEISIKSDVAVLTHYSYSSVIRTFKRYTGCTIIEYLHAQKIEYAKNLLRTTNKPMLEIAGLLGYDSLSSFNHLFKRYASTTPTKYRKSFS